MKTSDVGIADVVQATVALRPNSAGTEAIARMCGMELTTKIEDIGYPRRVEAIRAWTYLAERLRRRQSRVVVFAAVALARIPDELAQAVDLVLWDRSAVRRNVMQLAGVRDD